MKTTNRARRLLLGYLLTLIISWFVWCVVNINNYIVLSGHELWADIGHDFAEGVIETSLIYCFAVLSCELLLNYLLRRIDKKSIVMAGISVHILTNALFVLAIAYVYSLILPFENNLFYHIMIADFFLVELFSSTYIVLKLVDKIQDSERERLNALSESRKKEIVVLQTKLDMLNLQTNNHFIFNSFSTASGLIRHDPKAAESFIKRLALMYRYMTRNGNKHIVPISDELEFVDNYVHLLEGRYYGIEVKVTPQMHSLNAFVPPTAIQSLIENAVKHNGHGPNKTLLINVTSDGESIVVKNNIIERDDVVSGTNTGLNNLKKRYELLVDRDVQVKFDGQEFKVILPLIFEEDLCYESSDN